MNRLRKVLIVAATAGLLGSGVAYAAIPDSDDGEFHACVRNSPQFLNGDMRDVFMIDAQAGKHCQSGYTEKVWNQVGQVGPTGPAGPTGPPGSAGVTDTYFVSGGFTGIDVEPGSGAGGAMWCDSGDKVTGGGFAADQSEGGVNFAVVNSQPDTIDGVDGWASGAVNTGTVARTIHATVYAICLDLGTPHTP